MPMRRRLALGLILPGVVVGAIGLGPVGPARADDASPGTISAQVRNFTFNSKLIANEDFPGLSLYNLDGSGVGPDSVDWSGFDASGLGTFTNVPAGTYKIGLTLNARSLLQGESFGKNDASVFYSSSGATALWSKATTVHVSPGSNQSVSMTAASGARVTGVLTGQWINGPEMLITPREAPPRSALYNFGDTLMSQGKAKRTWDKKTKAYTLTFSFRSASLLPGKYVVWCPTLAGNHETLYYAGAGNKSTASMKKARTITITKATKVVDIGTFSALG